MLRFQSTFPRGERLWHIRDYRHIMLFQSTFPRGERRLLPERRDAMLGNFNPRSLVGNDVSVQRNLYRGFNFNPRSLVGNDAALYTLVPYCADFNPRSLVGNDQSPRSCRRCPRYFNPRSLVGNDDASALIQHALDISIHVPSWGTTRMSLQRRLLVRISIHVPSWGTTCVWYNKNMEKKFQSTFPRGERPGRQNDINLQFHFNPRSLVGNDGKFSQIFFVFLCNKYNFSTFYYPFSLFFSVIHVTFLIFVVRILPAFYVYF